MNGEIIDRMTPRQGQDNTSYQPRHAVPEPDVRFLEGQAQAADEFRHYQMFRQYLAEYDAERGPLDPAATSDRKESFTREHLRIAAEALAWQACALRYAEEKRSQIPKEGRHLVPYVGRHRKPEGQPSEPEAKEVPPPQEPPPREAVPSEEVPSQEPPPAQRPPTEPPPEPPSPQETPPPQEPTYEVPPPKEPPPPTEAPPPKEAKKTKECGEISMDELLECCKEEPPSRKVKAAKEPRNWPDKLRHAGRRIKDAWYAAGAALGSYFNHPEKGRRRRVVAVLAGYAAVGAASFLAGKWFCEEAYAHREAPIQPPAPSPSPTQPVHPPIPPQPFPPAPPVPPIPPIPPIPPHAPPFTEHFFDNLTPQNYQGETYEWGAVADSAGPANATPQLLGMIASARANGARVDTWGNVESGHWGITSVGVDYDDRKVYYDTEHKLAILQYLSKL